MIKKYVFTHFDDSFAFSGNIRNIFRNIGTQFAIRTTHCIGQYHALTTALSAHTRRFADAQRTIDLTLRVPRMFKFNVQGEPIESLTKPAHRPTAHTTKNTNCQRCVTYSLTNKNVVAVCVVCICVCVLRLVGIM